MSEQPVHPAYGSLVERINRFPQGAPPSESLYKILKILFSEREAELVAQLPIKPFTAEKAARIWKQDVTTARKTLDELASRAILVDIEHEGQLTYVLPPPMAGFFEFSMMRVRDDVDQKLLANLYYQYCTVEEDFMDALVGEGETQLGRVFVNEPVLPPEVEVLDYERASEVIKTATHRGISRCYCRYKL
ncbi:MAG: (Fe-S)-binding protein, partial [Anaerolineae bacterium]|nr:(Fe-S)-binding protein [Anaerolineae bacterium]